MEPQTRERRGGDCSVEMEQIIPINSQNLRTKAACRIHFLKTCDFLLSAFNLIIEECTKVTKLNTEVSKVAVQKHDRSLLPGLIEKCADQSNHPVTVTVAGINA